MLTPGRSRSRETAARRPSSRAGQVRRTTSTQGRRTLSFDPNEVKMLFSSAQVTTICGNGRDVTVDGVPGVGSLCKPCSVCRFDPSLFQAGDLTLGGATPVIGGGSSSALGGTGLKSPFNTVPVPQFSVLVAEAGGIRVATKNRLSSVFLTYRAPGSALRPPISGVVQTPLGIVYSDEAHNKLKFVRPLTGLPRKARRRSTASVGRPGARPGPGADSSGYSSSSSCSSYSGVSGGSDAENSSDAEGASPRARRAARKPARKDQYADLWADPFYGRQVRSHLVGEEARIRRERFGSALRPKAPQCVALTLSGSEQGHADGVISAALFNHPKGISSACSGRIILVADSGNHCVRCVDVHNRFVTTLAGQPGHAGRSSGVKRRAPVGNPLNPMSRESVALERVVFKAPADVCASPTRPGVVYVCDTGNHCVKALDTINQSSRIIAGVEEQRGQRDGYESLLDCPISVCEIMDGTLLVVDRNGIRRVCPDRCLCWTVANTRKHSGWRDGPVFKSLFEKPSSVFCDGERIFVTDSGSHSLRMISFVSGEDWWSARDALEGFSAGAAGTAKAPHSGENAARRRTEVEGHEVGGSGGSGGGLGEVADLPAGAQRADGDAQDLAASALDVTSPPGSTQARSSSAQRPNYRERSSKPSRQSRASATPSGPVYSGVQDFEARVSELAASMLPQLIADRQKKLEAGFSDEVGGNVVYGNGSTEIHAESHSEIAAEQKRYSHEAPVDQRVPLARSGRLMSQRVRPEPVFEDGPGLTRTVQHRGYYDTVRKMEFAVVDQEAGPERGAVGDAEKRRGSGEPGRGRKSSAEGNAEAHLTVRPPRHRAPPLDGLDEEGRYAEPRIFTATDAEGPAGRKALDDPPIISPKHSLIARSDSGSRRPSVGDRRAEPMERAPSGGDPAVLVAQPGAHRAGGARASSALEPRGALSPEEEDADAGYQGQTVEQHARLVVQSYGVDGSPQKLAGNAGVGAEGRDGRSGRASKESREILDAQPDAGFIIASRDLSRDPRLSQEDSDPCRQPPGRVTRRELLSPEMVSERGSRGPEAWRGPESASALPSRVVACDAEDPRYPDDYSDPPDAVYDTVARTTACRREQPRASMDAALFKAVARKLKVSRESEQVLSRGQGRTLLDDLRALLLIRSTAGRDSGRGGGQVESSAVEVLQEHYENQGRGAFISEAFRSGRPLPLGTYVSALCAVCEKAGLMLCLARVHDGGRCCFVSREPSGGSGGRRAGGLSGVEQYLSLTSTPADVGLTPSAELEVFCVCPPGVSVEYATICGLAAGGRARGAGRGREGSALADGLADAPGNAPWDSSERPAFPPESDALAAALGKRVSFRGSLGLQLAIGESDVVSDGDGQEGEAGPGRPGRGERCGGDGYNRDITPSPEPEFTSLRCQLKFLLSDDRGDIPASTHVILSTRPASAARSGGSNSALFSEVAAVLSCTWLGFVRI